MRYLHFLFLFLLSMQISFAQVNLDLDKVYQADGVLSTCRTAYNLDVKFINKALSTADSIIFQIKEMEKVIQNDPVIPQKYNAEYFYLNFLLQDIQSGKNRDSIKYYLKFAFLSIQRAKMEFQLSQNLRISENEISVLYEEIKNLLTNYDLTNLIRESSYTSESLSLFKPRCFSSYYRLPRKLFKIKKNTTLKEIDKQLIDILENSGYGEFYYFKFENGYAVVPNLEKISPEGVFQEESRFVPYSVDLLAEQEIEFTIWSYLKALFNKSKSHYRLMVFVVTDKNFRGNCSHRKPKGLFVQKEDGNLKLPKEIKNIAFTEDHDCWVLTYEFSNTSEGVELIQPGLVTTRTHLKEAGILTY